MKTDIAFLIKQLWDIHVNECWEMPTYVFDMMVKYGIGLEDIGVKKLEEFSDNKELCK